MWILGIRNDLGSTNKKCVTCKKGRAQTIAPVMANLYEQWLEASTVFTNVRVDYFGSFIGEDWVYKSNGVWEEEYGNG